MFWFLSNLLAFLGTPIGLILGWYGWAKRSSGQQGPRSTVELPAILSATLAPVPFLVGHFSPNSLERVAGVAGIALAIAAILLSLTTSWQMVLAVCLTVVGGVLLVFGLTLP